MSAEAGILKRGKRFHQIVQRDWRDTAKDGRICIERTLELTKQKKAGQRGKRGRMDIVVDELGDFVSVIEIKSTDWDRVKKQNIQRLLGSHRRQVWKYIEEYIDVLKKDVCPGIIYSRLPRSMQLRRRIEEYLNEYGLQVVWYEEHGR